jgi:AraC-like DNA-binding protein
MSVIDLVGCAQVRAMATGNWGLHFEAGEPAMFHLVEVGECWIRAADFAPLRLVPGEVAFVKAGIPHDILSTPTSRPKQSISPSRRPVQQCVSLQLGRGAPRAVFICGTFHFGQTLRHPLLGLLPPLIHLSASGAPDAAELAALLRRLAQEASEGRPGADFVVRRLSDVFFVQILRAWVEAHPDRAGGWLAAANDPQIGAALRAIHSDPGRAWTVETLSREAALSRSLFAARFRRLSGETPMRYVARWRVLLAAHALRSGRETVAALAADVGYASVAAFVRAFTRSIGMSPVAYRRAGRATYAEQLREVSG